MESRCECETGSHASVEFGQSAWRRSGKDGCGLVGIESNDVPKQRRKVESDALKMREFLAEGDVSAI